jgi:hypothetical protein
MGRIGGVETAKRILLRQLMRRDNVNFFMALGFSNNEINRDFKIENVFKKIRFSDLFFFFV